MPRELYVCVGTIDDPHSSVWKLWVQGDEFYALQSSNGGGTLCKLTVHESGICRLANVDRTTEGRADWGVTRKGSKDAEADPDVIHRWEVTKPGSPDLQPVLTILVPTVFLRERPSLADHPTFKKAGKVRWVLAAPLGFSTLIDCVRVPVEAAPEVFDVPPEQILGTLTLRCGDVIYVVRNRQVLPSKDFAFWQREAVQAIFTSAEEITEPTFASIISPANFAFPVIREVALGVDNFQRVDVPVKPRRGRPSTAKAKKQTQKKKKKR